jgi:hypothetical protein
MSDSGDVFDDDPEMDEFAETYDRHRDDVYGLIVDYMEEQGLEVAYLAQLLIDLMIRMRMNAYGLGVESPSVTGLKLDLDRLQAELGEFLREAKKGAAEYIEAVKDARAEADEEAEADEVDKAAEADEADK